MNGAALGLDVVVDRGVAIFRVTPGEGPPDARRLGEQALAQLRAFGGKGVRGLLVDLTGTGATDGASLAAIADALGPLFAAWEGRGLPLAVVAGRGRPKLEASRVVAMTAPRWGRVVDSEADARRWASAPP